jgi:hypothetical protein
LTESEIRPTFFVRAIHISLGTRCQPLEVPQTKCLFEPFHIYGENFYIENQNDPMAMNAYLHKYIYILTLRPLTGRHIPS